MIKQRQAMTVTPKQLRELADELEKEYINTLRKENIGGNIFASGAMKFQVNIVNESDCSDTWRFESKDDK